MTENVVWHHGLTTEDRAQAASEAAASVTAISLTIVPAIEDMLHLQLAPQPKPKNPTGSRIPIQSGRKRGGMRSKAADSRNFTRLW